MTVLDWLAAKSLIGGFTPTTDRRSKPRSVAAWSSIAPRTEPVLTGTPQPRSHHRGPQDLCSPSNSQMRRPTSSPRGSSPSERDARLPLVAHGGPGCGLPLRLAVDPEKKSAEARTSEARPLSLREATIELMIDRSLASRRSAHAAHGACVPYRARRGSVKRVAEPWLPRAKRSRTVIDGELLFVDGAPDGPLAPAVSALDQRNTATQRLP